MTDVRFSVIAARELSSRNVDATKYNLLYVRFAHPNFPAVIRLAQKFKSLGKPVVDKEWVDKNMSASKLSMYSRLESAGVPIPKTEELSPTGVVLPAIVKWIYGYGGKHVWLVRDKKELDAILKLYPRKELLSQEFISSSFEYKVVTVGYKALPFVIKYKIDPLRLTASLIHFEILKGEKSQKYIRLAEKASKVMGRQLAKVDIMERKGKPLVLEVNRSPGLEPIEKASKVNIFKAFIYFLARTK